MFAIQDGLRLSFQLDGIGIPMQIVKHDAVTVHSLSNRRILVSQGSHSDLQGRADKLSAIPRTSW